MHHRPRKHDPMTPYSLMQRITISLALSACARSMVATHAPVGRRPRRGWRWWLPPVLVLALCLGACAHVRPASAPEPGPELSQTPDLTPDSLGRGLHDALAGAGVRPR